MKHTCSSIIIAVLTLSVVVIVVLTLTRIIKSVVTGQAPVTLELRNTPGKNINYSCAARHSLRTVS